MCNHEQPQLVGTAEGIRCRTCGKLFHSFDEIERDRAAADAPAESKPVGADAPGGPSPAPAEKPKTERRKKTDD